jgi:hypothetical protein
MQDQERADSLVCRGWERVGKGGKGEGKRRREVSSVCALILWVIDCLWKVRSASQES